MTLNAVLEGVEILALRANGEQPVSGVCFDSHQAQPGSVFVAVPGFVSDGLRFAPQAAQAGAAVCVCQQPPPCPMDYVLVADSRLALAQIAANFYGHPARSLTLAGVTGTNGKTTSTMLLCHLLQSQPGWRTGLIGTNQIQIGTRALPAERTTPESLDVQRLLRQMVDAGCTHGVMEVSSHALALHRVEDLVFQVGVFTNLTQDHLDFHGTMERYAQAKAHLFARHCRQGVINLDDPWGGYMCRQARCPVLGYGVRSAEAALRADKVELSARGVRYEAVYRGRRVPVSLGIPGLFSVYNSLGVLGAGLCLGLDLEQAAAALASASGVKGRVELVPGPEDCTVVIDYAHTPDSLENILRTLRPVAKGRLVVVFGCGGDRDRGKRPIMGAIAQQYADLAIVTSDNPRTEEPEEIIRQITAGMDPAKAPFLTIPLRPEAIGYALDQHQPGDVILLAGKGHETYQEVGHEKRPMDERQIVAQWLAQQEETR